MKTLKRTVNLLLNILIVLFAFFSVAVMFMAFTSRANGVPNLAGYVPLAVQTNSMEPLFSEGDLIIGRQVQPGQSLETGDVITYWTVIGGQRVLNTHRIVEAAVTGTSAYYTTRGDANPVPDDRSIVRGDVVCVYTGMHVKGLGNAIDFLATPNGILICTVVPVLIFFILQCISFVGSFSAYQKAKAEILTEEEKRKVVEEYLAAQGKSEPQQDNEATE